LKTYFNPFSAVWAAKISTKDGNFAELLPLDYNDTENLRSKRKSQKTSADKKARRERAET